MAKKRDLTLLEEEAARLEQKAREMRQELARLKREETERQESLAGRSMRKLWARWEWVTIEDVETSLTEVFGPPPSRGRGAKIGSSPQPNRTAERGDEGSPGVHGEGGEEVAWSEDKSGAR